jgi:antirestriction protein ArdC
MKNDANSTSRQDVYSRITSQIVASLAFLYAHLELATEPREENVSYIANWLEVLKNDSRYIFKAAAHAQRAADYIRAFSGGDHGTATTSASSATTATASSVVVVEDVAA